MSAWKVDVTYAAQAQLAQLPKEERAALMRLLANQGAGVAMATRSTSDGRFVSRFGNKRVLWRKNAPKEVQLISVIDKSFAQSE